MMINTIIFDLDGTLINSEHLKAISYAQAAIDLSPGGAITEKDVIEAYKTVVGLSREEIGAALVQRFDLTKPARARLEEFETDEPNQVYINIRLQYYDRMLADEELLRNHKWPHTISLLGTARDTCEFVGLATMSHRPHADRVLDVLEIRKMFDFIATIEDVATGKPEPDIFLLVADALGVLPETCLVIEDSPAGVQAALRAGMSVVATSTAYTKAALHASGLLPKDRIIDQPEMLASVAAEIVNRSRR